MISFGGRTPNMTRNLSKAKGITGTFQAFSFPTIMNPGILYHSSVHIFSIPISSMHGIIYLPTFGRYLYGKCR